MKPLLSFCLLFLTVSISYAQQITGSIKDEQGKALPGATVALKKSTDSSVVKLGVTNSAGTYLFVNISNGKYFINTPHILQRDS